MTQSTRGERKRRKKEKEKEQPDDVHWIRIDTFSHIFNSKRKKEKRRKKITGCICPYTNV